MSMSENFYCGKGMTPRFYHIKHPSTALNSIFSMILQDVVGEKLAIQSGGTKAKLYNLIEIYPTRDGGLTMKIVLCGDVAHNKFEELLVTLNLIE